MQYIDCGPCDPMYRSQANCLPMHRGGEKNFSILFFSCPRILRRCAHSRTLVKWVWYAEPRERGIITIRSFRATNTRLLSIIFYCTQQFSNYLFIKVNSSLSARFVLGTSSAERDGIKKKRKYACDDVRQTIWSVFSLQSMLNDLHAKIE